MTKQALVVPIVILLGIVFYYDGRSIHRLVEDKKKEDRILAERQATLPDNQFLVANSIIVTPTFDTRGKPIEYQRRRSCHLRKGDVIVEFPFAEGKELYYLEEGFDNVSDGDCALGSIFHIDPDIPAYWKRWHKSNL